MRVEYACLVAPNYVRNPTWADGSGSGTAITAAKLNHY
jgi:hypothetical protein